MPVSRKRKNRGKGAGAKERARRNKEQNERMRRTLSGRFHPEDFPLLTGTDLLIRSVLKAVEGRPR